MFYNRISMQQITTDISNVIFKSNMMKLSIKMFHFKLQLNNDLHNMHKQLVIGYFINHFKDYVVLSTFAVRKYIQENIVR